MASDGPRIIRVDITIDDATVTGIVPITGYDSVSIRHTHGTIGLDIRTLRRALAVWEVDAGRRRVDGE